MRSNGSQLLLYGEERLLDLHYWYTWVETAEWLEHSFWYKFSVTLQRNLASRAVD